MRVRGSAEQQRASERVAGLRGECRQHDRDHAQRRREHGACRVTPAKRGYRRRRGQAGGGVQDEDAHRRLRCEDRQRAAERRLQAGKAERGKGELAIRRARERRGGASEYPGQ